MFTSLAMSGAPSFLSAGERMGREMTQRNHSGQFCPADRGDVSAVTMHFLDSAVSQIGLPALARALDIPEATLSGYRKGRMPNGIAVARFAAFFGGSYTHALMTATARRQRVQTEATPYANAIADRT